MFLAFHSSFDLTFGIPMVTLLSRSKLEACKQGEAQLIDAKVNGDAVEH